MGARWACPTARRNLPVAVRGYRNRAFNYKRGFIRRMLREVEAKRWFERNPDESPQERAAMQCLEKLPPEQREVIVLKIWHEHTYEEIGELLQLSPNTVAGRYRYGMEKLRACLNTERQMDSAEVEIPRDSAFRIPQSALEL